MFWLKDLNNCINDFKDIHCKAMVKLGIMLEEKTTLGCTGDLRSFNTFDKQFQIKKNQGFGHVMHADIMRSCKTFLDQVFC